MLWGSIRPWNTFWCHRIFVLRRIRSEKREKAKANFVNFETHILGSPYFSSGWWCARIIFTSWKIYHFPWLAYSLRNAKWEEKKQKSTSVPLKGLSSFWQEVNDVNGCINRVEKTNKITGNDMGKSTDCNHNSMDRFSIQINKENGKRGKRQRKKEEEENEIAKVFYLRCDAIQLCRHADALTPNSRNKHLFLRVLCLDPAKNRVELSFRVYLNERKMET